MIDHDDRMRIHAVRRGRVTVTRDGYQPRHGQLIAWLAPKRFEVLLDGAERSLTLRQRFAVVEPTR